MSVPADLDWLPVSSSNVAGIAYQHDFRRLFVRFRSGAVYAYEDVPVVAWEAFQAAPSKGGYVWDVLRNGGKDDVYAYRPVG